MRYVISKINENEREMAYRIYMTDTLFYYSDNKRLTQRFYDILHPPAVDNRTADEIAIDVIEGMKLKVE